MRLPRVRFTVRGMMVAVAVIAVMIPASAGSIRMLKRARYYEFWANIYARSEAGELGQLARVEASIRRSTNPDIARQRALRAGLTEEHVRLFLRDPSNEVRRAAKHRRMADHYDEMRRRFEAASWRPWVHVSRDPPPP